MKNARGRRNISRQKAVSKNALQRQDWNSEKHKKRKNVLLFGNKSKNFWFSFVLCSLMRTFVRFSALQGVEKHVFCVFYVSSTTLQRYETITSW